jgi:hypothetical protein
MREIGGADSMAQTRKKAKELTQGQMQGKRREQGKKTRRMAKTKPPIVSHQFFIFLFHIIT